MYNLVIVIMFPFFLMFSIVFFLFVCAKSFYSYYFKKTIEENKNEKNTD